MHAYCIAFKDMLPFTCMFNMYSATPNPLPIATSNTHNYLHQDFIFILQFFSVNRKPQGHTSPFQNSYCEKLALK